MLDFILSFFFFFFNHVVYSKEYGIFLLLFFLFCFVLGSFVGFILFFFWMQLILLCI